MNPSETTDPRLEGARLAAVAGNLALAEQLLKLVLRDAPESLPALDLLGYVLYFEGRPVEAEAACRLAVQLEPTRAYSNKGLGLCLAKQGEVDQGLTYLREAIRLAPEWFDPRWDMSIVLMDAGRYTEALDALDQAAAAIPTEAERFERLRDEVWKRSSAPRPR